MQIVAMLEISIIKSPLLATTLFLEEQLLLIVVNNSGTVLTSMSKIEYVAMSYGARKDVGIQRFLNTLLLEQAVRKMEIFRDNEISLILTRDLKS